jgi:hypothetical protein
MGRGRWRGIFEGRADSNEDLVSGATMGGWRRSPTEPSKRSPRGGPARKLGYLLLANISVFAATGVIIDRTLHLFKTYRYWALATVVPWLVALAISHTFRARARDWLARQVDRAQRFQQHGGAAPWGLALVLVAWPSWLFWLAHGVLFGAVDTRPAVLSSISLARYGTLDLTALSRDFSNRPVKMRAEIGGEPRPGFERRGSRIYSGYPLGMVPLAFPFAWAAQSAGAHLDESPVQHHLEKLAATTITAVACGLFFLVASRLSSMRVAAVATLVLVVGSAVWTTMASGLWQHGGVFLWSMVFLLAELSPSPTADGRRPGTAVALGIQGLAGTQLLLCRPTAALFVAFLNLWVLTRSRIRGLILGLINALGLLGVVAFNLWLYSDPRGGSIIRMQSAAQNWHLTTESLLGTLFSPARGLFVYQPWLLVLLPLGLVSRSGAGAGPDDDRNRRRLESLPIAGLVLAHTLTVASWQDWIGGWCWGSRLLAETVPLWLLVGLSGLTWWLARPWRRIVLGGVLVLSFLVHVATALVPPARWHGRFRPAPGQPIIWSVRDSPLAFAVRERMKRY